MIVQQKTGRPRQVTYTVSREKAGKRPRGLKARRSERGQKKCRGKGSREADSISHFAGACLPGFEKEGGGGAQTHTDK